VRIDYNPAVISYRQLLEILWASHEPGLEPWSRQYRNAVFTLTPKQQAMAEQSRDDLRGRLKGPVFTAVEPAKTFFVAEDYHQKYLLHRAEALFADLRSRYGSESELLFSTPATRINGYLGCNGSISDLENEVDNFGLSEGGRRKLLTFVKDSCSVTAGPTCPAPQ